MKNKIFEFVLEKLIKYEISKNLEPFKYFKNKENINDWCEHNGICFKTNHKETEYYFKTNEKKNNIIESYAGWHYEKINGFLREKTEFDEVPFYITNSIEVLTNILKNRLLIIV